MFFTHRHHDYVQDLERIGAASLERLHARDAQVEQHRMQALDELKRFAIQKAIVVERLKWGDDHRLNDPWFKRQVQNTASELLFQSHLQLSI